MSAGRDELALRKDVLVVQCALYRAQLGCEAIALRSRVARASTWMAAGLTMVSAVRTLLAIVAFLRR